jgi:membrane-bound lytic murein transglycosylase D
MKNFIFCCLLFLAYPVFSTATIDTFNINLDADAIAVNEVEIVLVEEENLDSLILLWYVQQNFNLAENSMVEEITDSVIAEFPDSVYIQRLEALNSYFPLTYNRIVRNYIHVYTHKKRDKLETILGLREYYFPFFEEVLDLYQLPLELKYLPVIESALNPRAVSRVGATGLWQFMYGTGRMYKLQINTFIDERRDPIKSTHAACRFLKDLYAVYGDWQLVIAAYNCGPGNVNKAIRRSGGKRDYWEIYPFLPKETRGYVPAFIAAFYAISYHTEHNIKPQKIDLPVKTDTIQINKNLHLQQVAEVLNIPIDLLRDLNPQYKIDIIPGENAPNYLRLPLEFSGRFIDQEAYIYTFKDSLYLNKRDLLTNPTSYANSNARINHVMPSGDVTRLTYTVKSGDNLGLIAAWYHVPIASIRQWNNIQSNTIRIGQKLTIYVPANKAHHYRNINEMSFSEKQKVKTQPVQAKTPQQTAEKNTDGYTYYTVKQGDTLWDIARRHPGVSESDLRNWNNFNNSSKIIPGQKIKILVK